MLPKTTHFRSDMLFLEAVIFPCLKSLENSGGVAIKLLTLGEVVV